MCKLGRGLRSYQWLAVSLTLLSFTQLRFRSLPVGIGEILLLLWSGTTLLCEFWRNRSTRVLAEPLPVFWSAALCIFGFASLVTLVRGHLPCNALHDAVAFFFSFLFCTALSVHRSGKWLTGLMKAYAYGFFCYGLGLSLLSQLHLPYLSKYELWYGGVRFEGLANNPNQLGLYLLPLPFFFLYLGERETAPIKWWLLFAALISLVIGYQTKSDALMLAWLSGFFLYGLRGLWRFMRNPERLPFSISRFLPQTSGWQRGVFFFCLLSVSSLAFGVYAEKAFMGSNGHGDVRVWLWTMGLYSWATSPWFGNGFGVFSGMDGPMGLSESHNFYIDWIVSSGALGLLALASLLWWIFLWSARSRSFWMVCLLISSLVISSFYSTGRQPIFWMILFLAMQIPRTETGPPTRP